MSLLSSTYSFSEHIGNKFAAGHPYIYKEDIIDNLPYLGEDKKDKKLANIDLWGHK